MSVMTAEQFDREASYRAALAIASVWLRAGYITEKEYGKIQPILARKFSPVWGGLRRKCA